MPPAPAEQLTAAPVLVIACGALVRELRAVVAANGWDHLDVAYLPAPLHNRPERIVAAIAAELDSRRPVGRMMIGYADCGTGGALDRAIDGWRAEGISVQRLPGNHCYEFFAGSDAFAELHDEELGTFFLTDYLARHFELLIWQGMGLADHPELLPMYFGNYRRVVLLTQHQEPDTVAELVDHGRAAATRLGLEFEHRPTGLAPFTEALVQLEPTGAR